MTEFERIAPRLALAHQQCIEELRHRDLWQVRRTDDVLRLKRLVAQRDLELVQAQYKGQPSHIRDCKKKLQEAQEDCKRVSKRGYEPKEW